MKDLLIQVRVDSKLKKQADDIFLAMGLKIPEAIRMFLQQTINDRALPFHPNAGNNPNLATLEAFNEIKTNKYSDSNLDDFKKSLGAKNSLKSNKISKIKK